MATYTVVFRKTRSPNFEPAVAAAKGTPTYAERHPDGSKATEYTATYGDTPAELQSLIALWQMVSASSRLEVDGVPYTMSRGALDFAEMLGCLTRALTFSPPQRYCTSSDNDSWRWPGRPPFSCRMLTKLRPRDLDNINWADAERRVDAIRAVVVDRGLTRCPFFDLAPFETALQNYRPSGPVETPPAWASEEHTSRITLDLRGPYGPS